MLQTLIPMPDIFSTCHCARVACGLIKSLSHQPQFHASLLTPSRLTLTLFIFSHCQIDVMGGRGVSDVVAFAVDGASLLLPLLLLLLLFFRIIGVGGCAAAKSCCAVGVDVFVVGDWGGVINESSLIGEFNNDGFGIFDVLLLLPLLLVLCLAGEADIIDVVDRRELYSFFCTRYVLNC